MTSRKRCESCNTLNHIDNKECFKCGADLMKEYKESVHLREEVTKSSSDSLNKFKQQSLKDDQLISDLEEVKNEMKKHKKVIDEYKNENIVCSPSLENKVEQVISLLKREEDNKQFYSSDFKEKIDDILHIAQYHEKRWEHEEKVKNKIFKKLENLRKGYALFVFSLISLIGLIVLLQLLCVIKS